MRPRIAVIGTGGSISTPGRDPLDLFEYSDYGRTLEVDELLALFPEVHRVADVHPVRFRAIVSPAMTPADWLELATRVQALRESDPDLDGIVITHGTSTIEETAYFLHLTLKVDLPVVLVGAQRPPNGLSSDAGLNLLNAIRVAGSRAARGLGVLVALNDEIHSAREVTKTSNFRLQTFHSPEVGVLGHIDPDGIATIYRQPTRRHTLTSEFDVRGRSDLPRVEIVYSYAGADGDMLRHASGNAAAVVVACMSPGILPARQRDAVLECIRQSVPVVLSNRGGMGRLLPRTKDVAAGIVTGDNLNPQKCRVLTMLALTVTRDLDEMRRIFGQY